MTTKEVSKKERLGLQESKPSKAIMETKNGDLYIIYEEFGKFYVTNKDNYDARVSNEREIVEFEDASSLEDCIKAAEKYMKLELVKVFKEKKYNESQISDTIGVGYKYLIDLLMDIYANSDILNYSFEIKEIEKITKTSIEKLFVSSIKYYSSFDEYRINLPKYIEMKKELEGKASLTSKDEKVLEKLYYGSLKESSKLPSKMVKDYEKRAEYERRDGGYVDIDTRYSTIEVVLSDGSEYFFQDWEADDLLDEVPDNIDAEDYILAIAQGW